MQDHRDSMSENIETCSNDEAISKNVEATLTQPSKNDEDDLNIYLPMSIGDKVHTLNEHPQKFARVGVKCLISDYTPHPKNLSIMGTTDTITYFIGELLQRYTDYLMNIDKSGDDKLPTGLNL